METHISDNYKDVEDGVVVREHEKFRFRENNGIRTLKSCNFSEKTRVVMTEGGTTSSTISKEEFEVRTDKREKSNQQSKFKEGIFKKRLDKS